MTKDYALYLLNKLCIGASVEAMSIIPQFELAQALSVAIKALEQQPCEDCINREAVDEYITNLLSGYLYDEERTRLEDLTAYIWELPPVTPQQKIGHWEVDEDRIYTCNQCNKRNLWHSLFCPNCGAKMVELQESEEEE